ncbi:hypothetical protein KCP74_03265 [Salmonella enterica subsp. enterica]|nr:hypothetical protein KCP74_03265 [Salmonella enterica subsp. enterica]
MRPALQANRGSTSILPVGEKHITSDSCRRSVNNLFFPLPDLVTVTPSILPTSWSRLPFYNGHIVLSVSLPHCSSSSFYLKLFPVTAGFVPYSSSCPHHSVRNRCYFRPNAPQNFAGRILPCGIRPSVLYSEF